MNYENCTKEELEKIINNLSIEVTYCERKRDTKMMMDAIRERKKAREALENK
ncbi:hypothetical protein JK628_02830 [Shewanella sp. KX20019]|uniref:hypothetical protein n=1 Tax=Shewanella sp. KX20019 TaxID=2803864 RepID=UPI0019253F30|nr:hypothetical protein [Shewanella sp. KX20019]QQX80824.1 hypothetical protein JK628_02830 [Shewanella sp. KX20019]